MTILFTETAMQTRRVFLRTVAVVLPATALTACESLPPMLGGKASGDSDLIDGLTKQTGVNKTQAAGGLGAVLAFAKEKLSGADFSKIANVIPGADKYLKSASDLGAVSGNLGDMKGLTGALGKLGMNGDQSAKFPTAVTEQVGKLGGADIGRLLGGVLK